MPNTSPEEQEPSPGLLTAQVVFPLVMALLWALLAFQQPPAVGAVRFLMPLLFCYSAALAWVQRGRHARGERLKQPPPVSLRLFGLALCGFVTYSLLQPPPAGGLRVLLYIGLAAFWGVVVLMGKRYREMNRERGGGNLG